MAELVQRILGHLDKLRVPDLPHVRLIVSIGWAVFTEEGLTAKTLLASAGRAMYTNKRRKSQSIGPDVSANG